MEFNESKVYEYENLINTIELGDDGYVYIADNSGLLMYSNLIYDF